MISFDTRYVLIVLIPCTSGEPVAGTFGVPWQARRHRLSVCASDPESPESTWWTLMLPRVEKKPLYPLGAYTNLALTRRQILWDQSSDAAMRVQYDFNHLISTFKSSFFGMCKKATSAAPGMTALETFPDGANVGRWLSTALAKGSVGFRKMTHIHPYPLFLCFPSWIWIGREQKHGLLSWSDAVGLSPLLSTKAPC